MKMTRELKRSITKEVADELVSLLEQGGEVVFISFDRMKELIKASAMEKGIEIENDDDVMDELMDYVKAKLIALRNGWDIYFPETTYIHKNNFVKAEANGLIIVKEAK
jgi:transcriptional antiterminator